MSSNKHAAIALLKRGCELFYLTKTGNTALHLAVQNNEPLIIRKIVDSAFQRRRANELVNFPDRKGATALDHRSWVSGHLVCNNNWNIEFI